MAKDPESRDWKIDKYISKCIAIDPDKEPPSYEEVGQIIDKWDNMGRHITYPMAGDLWNQIEWQNARNVNEFIKQNFPNEIKIELFYGQNRLIKRVILPDGIEKVVAYNSETGEVGCVDINNTALIESILKGLDEPINQISKIKPVLETRKPHEILSSMRDAIRANEESRFIANVPGGYKMGMVELKQRDKNET
ncbi:hypothetical protein [Pelosinus sp. IPA-1]|uniref:hypothetical protein n=1 Tax=Pelosinus sp. IPA-1 TaxID=3029569 RepID=UPI0024361FD1|nr:hypothetical protein [Pelosinus sp. IPA-1]GMA99148.1 hypothetical protein PIPA1_19480 [Pelosinus sp. IPA-1]